MYNDGVGTLQAETLGEIRRNIMKKLPIWMIKKLVNQKFKNSKGEIIIDYNGKLTLLEEDQENVILTDLDSKQKEIIKSNDFWAQIQSQIIVPPMMRKRRF